MRRLLFLFTVIITFASLTTATTIHVPDDQPTIQDGLNSAVEGDTVLVAPGTYYENIVWPAVNGIKLIGSGQQSCIIDGDSLGSVIRFEWYLDGILDTTTQVHGFTIQNGCAQAGWPFDCGGGIHCYDSSPSFINLRITENVAIYGGGIYCNDSSPSLINLKITENVAVSIGGGAFIDSYNQSLITGVVIAENSAAEGGGVFLNGAHTYLINVTIAGNTASTGAGLTCWHSCHPILDNCVLWSNTPLEVAFVADCVCHGSITITCSDIQGGEDGIETNDNGTVYWLEHNIDADPLFCDPDSGDYRLQLESPCRTDVCGFMGYTGETCDGESVEERVEVPSQFGLINAYPNPFNPATTIEYSLAIAGEVTLSVYNIRGQLVDVIQDGYMVAGWHSATWTPASLPSGIYFVELRSGGNRDVMKVMYVK